MCFRNGEPGPRNQPWSPYHRQPKSQNSRKFLPSGLYLWSSCLLVPYCDNLGSWFLGLGRGEWQGQGIEGRPKPFNSSHEATTAIVLEAWSHCQINIDWWTKRTRGLSAFAQVTVQKLQIWRLPNVSIKKTAVKLWMCFCPAVVSKQLSIVFSQHQH